MSAPQPSVLTLDAVVDYPRPGGDAPTHLAFSPDGRFLSYLWSERGDLIRDLWAMDLDLGDRRPLVRASEVGAVAERNLQAEEELRRERLRVREGGVTQYRWAANADALLIPVDGQLYVASSRGEPPAHVAPSGEAAVDAQVTPDGHRVVLARGRELWVAEVHSGAVRQLTFDASDTVANGVAEFVAQEEMGRHNGFWISPDGTRIAYAQVDEGAIPSYPIVHQGANAWTVEHHRYPFAGGANARVRLGIIAISGGPTHWLDLGLDPEGYLARVHWAPDGRLFVQLEARDQRRLELRSYDPETGEGGVLLVEESEVWINLHDDLRALRDGRFVWSSERTGFRHLYLYDPAGALVRPLTNGSWAVDGIAHVDEARQEVYFTAGRESPLEGHLYRVSLAGGGAVRVTHESGFHSAVFAASGECYAHTFESLSEPPSVAVRWVESDRVAVVHQPRQLGEVATGLKPPELVQLAADDATPLFGAIYRPEPSAVSSQRSEGPPPSPSPPLIIAVYGGPHAQLVKNAWDLTVDLRAQHLASLGFVVFKLDNRGSARRGLAFEGAIRGRLGSVEVADQVAGVRWLADRRIADPDRVGIYGWSYGGYMAAMSLLTRPDVFKVAVAGAPVVDWDGYDTHYTERYMGLPAENPEGYRGASLLTYAGDLRGKLLIIHGLLDENVHFRHSGRLIAALEEAGRPFDLLLLPAERHGLRHAPRGRASRRYVEERIAEYFSEHL